MKTKLSKQVSLGALIRENMPLSYVHYPNHYGTFFAFSELEDSQYYFCECSKVAISNYLELKKLIGTASYTNPLRMAPLDSYYFPDIAAKESLNEKSSNFGIKFKKGICHRCIIATPTLFYCHPMYGSSFMQNYGWYVKLQYFKLGINPSTYDFQYYTPDYLVRKILTIRKKHNQEHEQAFPNPILNKLINERDENLVVEEDLKLTLAQITRGFTKEIENIVREEFGVKKVGEGWVSETILKNIIQKLFPEEKIIFHYRSNWLEGLELDIFLEKLNLAFEYQGQQHYHPIEAWGGNDALEKVKERDRKKKFLCRKHGVRLIEVKYTDPLDEDFVMSLVKRTKKTIKSLKTSRES